jgi:hypothetical protein
MPDMQRKNKRAALMKKRRSEFLELLNSSYWDYLPNETKCNILGVLLEMESDRRRPVDPAQ